MAINRRALLGAAASCAGAGFAGPLWARKPSIYLSAAAIDGDHHALVFTDDGTSTAVVELPERGHGGALHPYRSDAVVFARRPGTFAFAFDRNNGRLLHRMTAPPGRHFYGHGTYARGGRWLLTSENDFDGERGVIGIWDVDAGYRRLGEFDSAGIGPHDIKVLGDGHTLVIANGGLLTHPETGRHKLNVPDMDPSLALIDGRSGEVQSQFRLPRELHKLSIRHLAVQSAERIIAALQYEGPSGDIVPLVAILTPGGLMTMSAPDPVQAQMRNYCGAIALDAGGMIAAVSCPRGNLVTFWSALDGSYLSQFELADGCGVAPTRQAMQFIVSSGHGERLLVDLKNGTQLALPAVAGTQWDNHITSS
jgi:hypothetical protein